VATKGTNAPDAAAWAAALNHRPAYKLGLAEYHAVYEVKERGMKKWLAKARTDWIAAGCPAGGPDFPPLDDAPKMLAWWLAHMEHAPSLKLYTLAGVAPDQEKAPEARSGAPAASTSSEPPHRRTAVDVAAIEGLDLAGAALRQRKLVAAALGAYENALGNSAVPEATVTLLSKRYDEAIERLRKIEDSLTKTEESRGNMVHVNDLRAEIVPLLLTLASSLPAEMSEQLGIDRVRATLFADRWFRHLRASRFLEGVVPTLSPTTAAA
jgi:hypothetical protein